MNRSREVTAGLVAVAMLVTATACSNSGTDQGSSLASESAPSSAPAVEDGEAQHNAADVKFVHHMIPHHEQAIEMSDMVLAKAGIDTRVSELATQIKAAQGPEIDQMQQWLAQWGVPTMAMTPGMEMPGTETPGAGHPPHHGAPATGVMPSSSMTPGMGGMPAMEGMMGMMSPAEMEALNSAQGVEASKLFLTQMITHHEGAITMADNEIKQGQFPAAIGMAESIRTSQQKEIETMRQILSSL